MRTAKRRPACALARRSASARRREAAPAKAGNAAGGKFQHSYPGHQSANGHRKYARAEVHAVTSRPSRNSAGKACCSSRIQQALNNAS
jgi:hypothetical protein